MKAYTRRRLFASAKLGLASIPFMIVIYVFNEMTINQGTFLLGFGMGFAVGIAQLFILKNWMKKLPFLPHLILKSALLVFAVLYPTYAVLNLLDVFFSDLTWSGYFAALFHPDLFWGLLQVFGVISFLLFFVDLDRLLGPGVLLGYVTGRYHHPRRESRIFMFLDMKDSTKLADTMEANQYFSFLNLYFTEMSESILTTNAEIYQYVGDEVVLTWKMSNGLDDANCINVFFLIEDQINSHRERFLATYGVVPEFKAGLHAGEVVVAQIGELKSEIVYNGDVLNTTARIQALCNTYNEKLIISSELLQKLSLGEEFEVKDLGMVSLRGKSETLELSAVRRMPIQ